MRKTVGIVIENYVSGGSDVVANQLARHLSGWDVVIFTNRGNDDRNLVRGLDLQRIRLVRYGWRTLAEFGEFQAALRKRGRPVAAWLVRCFNLAIRYPHIFLSAWYLARSFQAHRIDFVVSNNGGYPGGEMCRAAVLGARLKGIGALMIVHNMPTAPPAILRPMEKIMDRLVGRVATPIAVSTAVAEALARTRFLGTRAAVIENAVARPAVQPVGRQHLGVTDILCIGAIAAWKDQIKAVDAYRRLVAKLTACRPGLSVPTLTLIGPIADQDYYDDLTRTIARGRIEGERVLILGYRDAEQYLTRPGQLLLISSNVEGLPLVLLEAMSYGVPAVATDVGGIGAVITHGVNGELRPVGDVEGLAKSLWLYVTDRAAYAAASKQCIETFNARYSTDGWIEKYQNLMTSLSHGLQRA